MSATAKRYARAAQQALADKPDASADQLVSELHGFVQAVAASAALREGLHNPAFKVNRESLLASVLTKLGIQGLGARLIDVLVKNDRVDLISDVAHEMEALADARAGRVRAQVRSAIPLSEAQQSRLAKALTKRVGKPVAVTVQVDATVLGGLVCQAGDVTFDSSLKRQLDHLTERLGA